MSVRIAINGLGRIGRILLRLAPDAGLEVVAVNDLAPVDELAYLVKYDSAHGRYRGAVGHGPGRLVLDGREIRVLKERDPARLPWGEIGVETVAECTGVFLDRKGCAAHLAAGARRVVLSAPAKDADLTLVMGVNEDRFDRSAHQVVSNASCTTNCLAPVAKVLHEAFGIVTGFLTTVHAYTSSQSLVDSPGFRRGRAAAVSMVPTSTGAARAINLVLPELEGRLDGVAVRVPVLTGSLIDFVVATERDVSEDSVNAALRNAAESERLRGILAVTDDPLVSADIVGDTRSSVVDASSTMTIGARSVKVLAWYDNEWGYTARLADVVRFVSGGGARAPAKAS
jgi:glyceraldehyde 3-phosphate dehydrogenase